MKFYFDLLISSRAHALRLEFFSVFVCSFFSPSNVAVFFHHDDISTLFILRKFFVIN
jgi:hypothetical protein